MNWGKGITIAFILFALFIGSLVVIAFRTDFYLVSDDYYEKEIAYEDQIQRIKANEELASKISFEYDKGNASALFQLPDELKGRQVKGVIHFFRPSDANLDQKIEMKFDDQGSMAIDMAALKKGLWRIKLEFSTEDNREYYDERVLIL